jgi:hypothetical protein
MLSTESSTVSSDGRFVYICGPSVDGIVRVGTGRGQVGLNCTIEGHVYARRWLPLDPQHFLARKSSLTTRGQAGRGSSIQHLIEIMMVGGSLFVLTRLMGCSHIDVLELDPITLCDVANPSGVGVNHDSGITSGSRGNWGDYSETDDRDASSRDESNTSSSPTQPDNGSISVRGFVNVLHDDVEMEQLVVVAGHCDMSCSGISGIRVAPRPSPGIQPIVPPTPPAVQLQPPPSSAVAHDTAAADGSVPETQNGAGQDTIPDSTAAMSAGNTDVR